MLQLRKSSERGHANHGWLNTYHTFSFADYYDPSFMGFRSLRVINEDVVQAGQGFGTHPHRDMEIITYVLSGALEHKDSMGTGAVIKPGTLQYMAAGTGVTHSEFNPSKSEPVHLLQIWIIPRSKNLPPRYDQRDFNLNDALGKMLLLCSEDGRNGSMQINQDARIYCVRLDQGSTLEQKIEPGRALWLQVTRGGSTVNETSLSAGDGLTLVDESSLNITANADFEALLFDLA